MSEFIDALALPFATFADHVEPQWAGTSTISFLNPQITYSVNLIGRVAIAVPEKARYQCFDKQDLLPISERLGISIEKAATLIALRNAWVAYFIEGEISRISFADIKSQLTKELATEYVILTSDKWAEHPWIQERISEPEPRNHVMDEEERKAYEAQYRAWREEQEEDIRFHIDLLQGEKGKYTSLLDVHADLAEHDVKRAKKKIKELHSEIEHQEAVIRAAMKPIREHQKSQRVIKKRAPGRPKVPEEQQQQREIAKMFVAKWIDSLMLNLSIKNTSELAKTIGGQKMTWWRWQNKETLPPSSILEALLDVQIKSGPFKNTPLKALPTSPSFLDLIKLVNLV